MKKYLSWQLPDGEKHFQSHLRKNLQVYGIDSYQHKTQLYVIQFLKRRRVFIDVGSHCGFFSRHFCQRFKLVLAFEPIQEHRECFVKNVPYDNYELYPYALGDKEEIKRMCNPASKCSGDYHISEDDKGIEVEVRTLDSFNFKHVDFIKVDSENFEIFVLKGSKQTILRERPIIMIEQKKHNRYSVGQFDAARYIESLGMRLLGKVTDDYIYGWPKNVHNLKS